ncbi:MAG: cardiolipin synthase, partial [Erysipelotrichaceae bacterium]|nr:cardiolipin synthase [Erysipelotrichaceae bacterium]
SLTVMFIQFYNASAEHPLRYEDYLLPHRYPKSTSFVLPFSDSPTDEENVCRTVHFNLITKAKKYIYISTPYLILDHDMTSALKIAAKCGVEVIITVPHIPDKKSVFMVTRSNYLPLLKAGVKIYEYTPGFVHSKMVVSDDKIGLIGTINMDFRSYYLHYECGVLVAEDPCIAKMKEDYLEMIGRSEEITLQQAMKTNIFIRVFRSILNVFAPLL